jgi:hypothetical protein
MCIFTFSGVVVCCFFRSHFGAWAIVSSPLVLSHDVNDETITEQIWSLIANREVLEVNQVYVGDSGGVYEQSNNETIDLGVWDYWNDSPHYNVVVPVLQLFAKPLTHGRVAVLAMNHGLEPRRSVTIQWSSVPGVTCDPCLVRDIWTHETIGIVAGEIRFDIESHDSVFIVIAPPVVEADDVVVVDRSSNNNHGVGNLSFISMRASMGLVVVLWILRRRLRARLLLRWGTTRSWQPLSVK